MGVALPSPGQLGAGAYDDIQYTDRLNLAMPGYLNLALVEQLNNNMVTLDQAVLVDPDGVVEDAILDHPTLLVPAIADFSLAQHDHLDADDGGTLSGNAIVTQVTGAGSVVKQTGAVLVAPTLTTPEADSLAVNGSLAGPRRIDFRTTAVQRWSLYAAGGTEPGGDAGSDLTLTYFTDAGTLKGTAMSLRRTDGRVSFPHDVTVSGGLTVTGAVSMPNLDVGPQVASGIAAHEAKPDPHAVYATDADLASAITVHEAKPDPHPVYLTQARATPLFLPAAWGPQHLADTDPHPSYITQTDANTQLVGVGHLTDPTAHSQYLTELEATPLFLAASWGPAHLAAADPHTGYVTKAVADSRYILATSPTPDSELRLYIQQIMAVLDPGGPPPPP
jgi:hypothetical protein